MAEGTAQQIYSGEILLGSLGEVAPAVLKQWDLEKNVYIAELSVVQIAACRKKIKMFHEMPRYPAIERDLAVVVEESVSAGEIMRSVEDLNDGLIKEIRVFDFYRGGRIPKGYKNLAFRITYQADDRTLVSEDIQKLHDSIASRIAAQFQASFQA